MRNEIYTKFYYLNTKDKRKNQTNKERFLEIFKTMPTPEWIMAENNDNNEARIVLENKDGVVLYILIGNIKEIEEIEQKMADYAFSKF